MNRLVLILLLGMAAAVLLVPFVPVDGDLIRVDVYTSDQYVLLKGGDGQLELPIPGDNIYSSDDPYDFFPELIDPSSIQRVEFLPYGKQASCNVLTATGSRIAGHQDFCLVLALKLGVPVYAHKELFQLPQATTSGNLLV